jgi:hypothetical protein
MTSRDLIAAEDKGPQHYRVPPQLAMSGASADPSIQAHAKQPETTTVDPAITAFLNIYQLDQYTHDFQQALKTGALATLAHRIYGETGYQLIQLDAITESIRRRYGALAFSIGHNQSPTWLLFWKPQLELRRFYFAYRGEEIYKLQKLLAGLHLYRFNLDGIVGNRLMDAVIRFQRQSGLPVTGFPDPVTLFWVYHQNTEVSHG